MRILYPSDYFSTKKPDEAFADEATSFSASGKDVSVVNIDELDTSAPFSPLSDSDEVLYRGWMLNADGYSKLDSFIRECGATPFTSSSTYISTHHIPQWYPKLSDLTPETVVLSIDSDLESALAGLGWSSFFVKDYVKSLKTSFGSIIDDPKKIRVLIAEMEKFRGTIEGGLCVRRVEEFVPDSEIRYFVIDGVAYSPSGSEPPEIVLEVARRIDSRFFSVDVTERTDGTLRVVEIGDGQVSDLVGWSVDRLVEIFESVA